MKTFLRNYIASAHRVVIFAYKLKSAKIGCRSQIKCNNTCLCCTRDLPGVALVITFFTTLFAKKKLNKCAFSQILQHDCENIATMVLD